jgi:predicted transcriptional regulator
MGEPNTPTDGEAAGSAGEFAMLLAFFKALANENRLKMVALLAEGECTVRELAERLKLKEPTVSEHLALLREAGLVSVRAQGTYRVYAFDPKAMYAMNKALLSREGIARLADDADGDAEAEAQRVILKNYLRDGRLVIIPASRSKLLVVLRWLADQFEPGRRYTEAEVNAIITRHHPDYATLRRELIGHKLMAREKGVYWRL